MVLKLLRKIGRSGDSIDKEGFAEGTPESHGLKHDSSSAGAFTSDSDLGSIPSKEMNILLDPLEGEFLIKQASIDSSIPKCLIR